MIDEKRRSLRDRLDEAMGLGRPVEMYFGPSNNYYLAQLLEVGEDFVEFNALDEHHTVTARNAFPLSLIVGVTFTCIDMVREDLIRQMGGEL